MLVDVLRVLPSAYLLSSVTQKLIRENHILWSFSFLGWVRPKVTEDGRHWSQSTRIHSRRTNIYGLWGLRARLRQLLLGPYIVHVHGYTWWNGRSVSAPVVLERKARAQSMFEQHVGSVLRGIAVLQVVLLRGRQMVYIWTLFLVPNRQPTSRSTGAGHLICWLLVTTGIT